jgi:hypothetical protein
VQNFAQESELNSALSDSSSFTTGSTGLTGLTGSAASTGSADSAGLQAPFSATLMILLDLLTKLQNLFSSSQTKKLYKVKSLPWSGAS